MNNCLGQDGFIGSLGQDGLNEAFVPDTGGGGGVLTNEDGTPLTNEDGTPLTNN